MFKMYRSKKDVDKHVESLLSKVSAKEFKTRAYSIARLYFDVGDYANCQKYVEQYLTLKDNNAAAYKLLGQALQKMGHKEKALEQFKASLDIDPAQTSTTLDICELLSDKEVTIDIGHAKYWCEKAEATFPRHPVTFKLRERLIALSGSDPEELIKLLKSELKIAPKDAQLHARLLKHFLNINRIKEAFDHACNIEFGENSFINNIEWYEVLNQLLNHNTHDLKDWLNQLFYLTVRERICLLSITETPRGPSRSLIETTEHLHVYDQSIRSVANVGASPGFGDFHNGLLQHHRGQLAFHVATFLLKKAKKDQLIWRDAAKLAGSLMLLAWQTIPLDSKVNWLRNAPEKQLVAVSRWYAEGTYRCSQTGHYLCTNIQDKSQKFLDQITQCYSGTHWRNKLYEKIFSSHGHLDKIKTSYLASDAFQPPVFRLPRKNEVEAYDCDAQREYGSSLHHFVWTLLNYKNYAHFKCTLFDMLSCSATSCGPETLNKLDVHAYLYCATLTAQQQSLKASSYINSDKPIILPANISDLLCPLPQLKWWDCAYKFSQNELGSELTDIRATLSRGIEVVRCTDNHGLDPEMLCCLGRIFSERSKMSNNVDEKSQLETRAALYYSSAIPVLEKLKSKILVKFHDKRMFDYTHKDLGTKELNSLLEECKLYVANIHLNDGDYDKVIEILSNMRSPQAYYNLSKTYKKIALQENNFLKDTETKSKFLAILTKARNLAYTALDILSDRDSDKNQLLYTNIQELLEEIETHMNRVDPDLSNVTNYGDGKYSSDENISGGGEHLPIRNANHIFRNVSSTPKSTPKAHLNPNATNYRTAVESQILQNTTVDQRYLDRIENEIRTLQKRDTTINEFMEQTKVWFDENRKLGNQIISTINSNIQNTTDQFKSLKISVDQVKDQIDECRNECKDVGELKKEVAELKKEVNKLKKASSEQAIDDSDLYNLEDSTTAFAAQMPFAPTQVIPPFNQRLVPPFPVPPNPYQLYNQSLYNLYNQYSQFTQPPSGAVAQPIFDPTRAQVNYSGVYPTPDQMYLDVAHLAPPTVPTVPTVPPVPIVPPLTTVPTKPTVTIAPPVTTTSKPGDVKEVSRALPVNVVITSSDPLPTCTTTPAPILSVTIPPKHIKGTPHNYQIPMPSSNDTTAISPPVFVFPGQNNKTTNTTTSSLLSWTQASIFKTTFLPTSVSTVNSVTNSPLNFSNISGSFLDTSKSVVDGIFTGASPNTSLNKSRTLSERSNTSVDNYDPCPDFKPIVPLPAEVIVTTGEEDELVIFSARAKLFRFTDNQWKERGIGDMKLLKHRTTNKVRVLMRREQVHKICANHVITAEMEIKPMKNEAKAYFWVANDFADETVVLEKFCIRFKTADIALDFYNAFEKAREDASLNKTLNPDGTKTESFKSQVSKLGTELLTPAKENSNEQNITPSGKAVVGGFTFSSTPTFKPVSENIKSDTKPQETVTNKVNVFSGLSLKSNTTSPFSNFFKSTPANVSNPSTLTTQATNEPKKLNTSDTVEEFEPTIEFKPVVPLPALVDQRTGEEDETVLFEHRAKLFRFETSTKEWKERGLGNIKLLAHNENAQKVRLIMRREQIMKVCCNHTVSKDMVFEKMPNQDKAVTWCAKDFSEGELVAETFCLRFKTAKLCDEFIAAIKSAQGKIKDESKAAKEEQNATAKQSSQTFGDKFKAKAGSWYCDACYTNNLENFLKCACCEQPRPKSSNGDANPVVESSKPTANADKPATIGWGDKFKPKAGSWECKDCLVRNEPNVENCSACNSPKDPTKAKPASNLTSTLLNVNLSTGTTQFRFGIPSTPTLKPGSETTSIFDGTGAHKFSFGIPQNQPVTTSSTTLFGEQKPPANIFGTPNNSTKDSQPVDFTSKRNEEAITPVKPALLPTPKTLSSSDAPFGMKENNTFGFVFKPKTPTKGKSPVKSPHSQGDEDSDGDDHAAEDECNHSFTPVIPLPDKVEVVTGEENETELYGHMAKLYRYTSGEWKERGKGVVKILKHKDTDKLRVVMRRDQVLKICLNHALTSEVIYSQKDEKTWLFVANDFSEGELSLHNFCLRFKNKEVANEFKNAIDKALQGLTKKVDNSLTGDPKRKDENEDVVFVSEIQATAEEKQKAKVLMLPENFFTYKNKEPCQGCRGCPDSDSSDSAGVSKVITSSNDSKIPTAVTDKPNAVASIFKGPFLTSTASTPIKTSTLTFQSSTLSVYGTPTNSEKTLDSSIFGTPLGNGGSNAKPTTPSTTQSIFSNNTLSKDKPSIFSAYGEQQNLFGTPQSKSIFGSGDAKTTAPSKSAVLAPPKLITINASNENRTETITAGTGKGEAKTIFGESKSLFGNTTSGTGQGEAKAIFGESKSLFGNTTSGTGQGEAKAILGASKPLFANANFGTSSNQSIFSMSHNKPDKQTTEIKSIFGDDAKTENLFGSHNKGSIFGPGVLSNNEPKSDGISAFGSIGSQNRPSIFETNITQFIFQEGSGNPANQPSYFNKVGNEIKEVEAAPLNATHSKPVNTEANKEPEKKETPFIVDNTLSFAALSSSGDAFNFQSKPDFQWEGAGQQLFKVGQKQNANESKDKSKIESGAGDESTGADEEYDPHYEPIVPLPDKIVVTTGEEDEEKVFGERCKLYRYDERTREWKERGVGEMKILYHPDKKTYRLLLRREQVHKAVLNMLLYMDMELLPMKNSDRAWTWMARNFAENPAGEQETLAVRFKSIDLAKSFHDKIVECVRKLQAAAAKAIREDNEGISQAVETVSVPLRLPKHLEESARADNAMSGEVIQRTSVAQEVAPAAEPSAEVTPSAEVKQVHFEGEQYEEDEEYGQDYEDYYNEEDDESGMYYGCDGQAIITQGGHTEECSTASIQVCFDNAISTPKILVTDNTTGEILADMVIYTETEFKMEGDSCTWSGPDYTSNEPVDKTVTINFFNSETAMMFYDSCETSKAASYSSTDPES